MAALVRTNQNHVTTKNKTDESVVMRQQQWLTFLAAVIYSRGEDLQKQK